MTFINQPITDPNRDAMAVIQALLDEAGLGSLSTFAWNLIVQGASPAEVVHSIRQTNEYKIRFPGMAEREAKGLPAISEGEYIQWERQAYQLMRNAGMPAGFGDQPADFAEGIGNDVSINELQQRIADSFVEVTQAPPEVRTAFAELYGASGDQALAAYFLDFDRATPVLQRELATAQVVGRGAMFGFDLTGTQGAEIAAVGTSPSEATEGFQQISQSLPLASELVSETTDIADFELAQAQFGTSGEAARRVERRRQERQALTGGTAAGSVTNEGILSTRKAGR